MSLLKVNELSIQSEEVNLLAPLSFELTAGQLTGVIGASGSGKSLLAQALLGSVPRGFTLSGEVSLPQDQRVALSAQSASVLDPLRTVISQLKRRVSPGAGKRTSQLQRVNISRKIAACYPHQLSGGMAKKALLAQATWQQTDFVVADEPCCGLDTSSATELYRYLAKLAAQERRGVLVISHNLKHLLTVADDILVLKEGQLVEKTTPEKILKGLCAPYTYALWQAIPGNWGRTDAAVA
ncbi:ATP-binding cassette domain-containing protein [Shewanella sediminis]|uniref:ATP-binding cassette domain-containing protein n=1 Tax=Shewanella sediminis TaxID=271097 RepID=UPI001CBBC1D7|nr:ATP-binding cassette domain-containing protein [Shewanella sediminis]